MIDQRQPPVPSAPDAGLPATTPESRRVQSLLLRNTLAIGLARIGSVAFDGFTYVLTARYFGPAQYGQYLSILAFLNLVDVASDMTVMDITVREMSQEPERMGSWLSACTILRMALAVVGLAAFAVYVLLAHYSGQLLRTIWIAALILPAGALRTPLTLFRATMKMQYELGIVLTTRALNLLLFVWLIRRQGTMSEFFMATSASRILLALLCWAAVPSLIKFRVSRLGETLRRLFRESIPMALSGGFVAVQFKADILMLSRLSGAAAAGFYGAVAQLPEYSLYLPVIITTPVLPMMARAFAESAKERFQELYGNMLTAVVSVVIPVAVMAIVMPTATVTLLFGPQYASVSRVLPLLALSIVALWVSHATAIAAVAVGLQSHFVRIQLICVATYVVMDWLLIPRAGVMAAGAVRLLTTIIAPLLTYRLVKDAGFRLRVHELRPTLWSGGAMAATVWACSGLPIGLAGTAGVGVYAAALWTGRRLRRAKR